MVIFFNNKEYEEFQELQEEMDDLSDRLHEQQLAIERLMHLAKYEELSGLLDDLLECLGELEKSARIDEIYEKIEKIRLELTTEHTESTEGERGA